MARLAKRAVDLSKTVHWHPNFSTAANSSATGGTTTVRRVAARLGEHGWGTRARATSASALLRSTLTLQGGATHNYIADTGTLSIGFASDTVNLAFSGTDTIKALVISGVTEANGTWGISDQRRHAYRPAIYRHGNLWTLTR